MSTPSTPASPVRLGSITESTTEGTLEGRRAILLESKLKELDEAAVIRRRLLRELYFTMKGQQDPSLALHLEKEYDKEDDSPDALEFLQEWGVDQEARHFKSIALLDTDVPSPPAPPSPPMSSSPSPPPKSPSPDPLELQGQDEDVDMSMEIEDDVEVEPEPEPEPEVEPAPEPEVPDRSLVTRTEEAQVNATLDIIKDESDQEEPAPEPPQPEEDENEEGEPMPVDVQGSEVPATPSEPELEPEPEPEQVQLQEPETEPEQNDEVLPAPEAVVEVAALEDTVPIIEQDFPSTPQPDEMDVEVEAEAEVEVEEEEPEPPMSPPRRTLGENFIGSPHFRHTSPYPSPPPSPSFDDLAFDPKPTFAPPPFEPLITPYALSLYPLPPAPNKKDQKKKDKSKQSKGLELYRWQATIKYNPVAKHFHKTTKCLSSKEWAVGFAERRFLRAMYQVDVLKEKGRWSFRQPKRSKGPTLPKVHWDYLLDEMRWLQTDFREERKWKLAMAYEIVHAVADWHKASPEDRKAMCVQWRPPNQRSEDVDMAMEDGTADVPIDVEPRIEPDEQPDVQLDVQPEPQPPMEALVEPEEDPAPDAVIGAGAEDATENAVIALDAMEEERQEIKEEAMPVDLSAFRGAESAEAEDADGDAEQDADGEDGDGEGEDFKQSLLGLNRDPEADGNENENENENGTMAGDVSMTDTAPQSQAKSKTQIAKAIRGPLLQNLSVMDTMFDLSELQSELDLFSAEDVVPTGLVEHQTIKLPDLFPDLTLYGPFMSAADSSKGKLDKRVEETVSLGKISYASRLLDIKPILVSTLQPAKKRKFGEWDDLAEFYPGDDTNQEIRPTEFFLPQPPPLFSGTKKPKEYPTTRGAQTHLTAEQAQIRVATLTWTPEEDAQLKHLAYLYSLNWHLVADAFATWRKTISTDRRTEWDCMVRWDRLYGPTSKTLQSQQQQQQASQAEGDDNAPIGSRKASRSTQSRYKDPPPASPSVSLQMMPPPAQSGPLKMTDLNRKQIRRGYMYEAIKRVIKKREAALNKSATSAQTKSRAMTNIHETHALSERIFTPMELSQIKMERDRKAVEHMEMRKKEQIRLALARMPQNAGSKLPVSGLMGSTQVAQIRNMQAAQMAAQQQRAQAQAQINAANGPGASTPTPPMSRVPTVTQQAMLAQQSQVQAQLAAAQALQTQGQGQQVSPPRPGSSASVNGPAGSPPQGAAQQQQQQLLRAQQQMSMAVAGLPFDPSMVNGMTQEQIQTTMQHQMQIRLMMQQAQQGQMLANNARSANMTPVQSGQGPSPDQASPPN